MEIVAGLSKNVMQAYGSIESFELIGIHYLKNTRRTFEAFLQLPTLTLT